MQNLTKQETNIAGLIANGYVEKEIASELFISEHTVHTHARNIRKKINARNIADVTRYYFLQLGNPKNLVYGLLFLTIQLGMVATQFDFDARKGKRTAKNKIVNARRYDTN